MIRVVRTAAATLVVAAGLAALLATSPPPPPHLDLAALPEQVCRGEPVTLWWALEDGYGPPLDVEDLRWSTLPDGTLDPPLTGTPLDASGSLEVVPLAPTYVGVTEPENADLWWSPIGIDAADCAALGFQTPSHDLHVTAVQAVPGGATLLGLAPGLTPALSSRLLRWDASLTESPPVDLVGYGHALAVTGDGRVAVAGFERSDPKAPANAFLALLATDGTELWRARLDTAQAPSEARAVAFAPDGDLLLAGSRHGGAWSEGFVRRYAADGTLRWDHAVAGDGDAVATNLAVAADGRTFVAGTTRALLAGDAMQGFRDAFVRAVDGEGNALWAAQRATYRSTPAVALLTGDRVLLLGDELTAFEANGDAAWSRAPEAGDAWVVLAPDLAGGALVAASRETTRTFRPSNAQERRTDVAVFRFDADGGGTEAIHVLGSLEDEAMVALTAWPSAGQGGLALTGTTDGALLAPASGTSEQETFLLALNDDGPVPAGRE